MASELTSTRSPLIGEPYPKKFYKSKIYGVWCNMKTRCKWSLEKTFTA